MLIRVDESRQRPFYEQIADAIKSAIVLGDLRSGDRLPSGRDLAESSGVTLETVQRAYRLLAADGVVVSRVGRGTSVADDLDISALGIEHQLRALIDRAQSLGIDQDTVIAKLDDHWP